MVDFGIIMESMGFDKEAIINAFNVAAAIIEDVKEYAAEHGYEDDADALFLDFEYEYMDDGFAQQVRENFLTEIWQGCERTTDLTEMLVTNCLQTAFSYLEDTELFKEHDAHFGGTHPVVLFFGNETSARIEHIQSFDTDCGKIICQALDEVRNDKLNEKEKPAPIERD